MIEDNISEFFRSKPRFNIVLIGDDTASPEDISQKIGFKLIDIQKEIIEDRINISNIAGYTGLVDAIKNLTVNHKGIVLKNIDILLASLERNKRKAFFDKLLTTRFNANVVICVNVFIAEIPSYDDYNHGLVIGG